MRFCPTSSTLSLVDFMEEPVVQLLAQTHRALCGSTLGFYLQLYLLPFQLSIAEVSYVELLIL